MRAGGVSLSTGPGTGLDQPSVGGPGTGLDQPSVGVPPQRHGGSGSVNMKTPSSSMKHVRVGWPQEIEGRESETG